jgi:nucleotide-binding universal stress UspA family protein
MKEASVVEFTHILCAVDLSDSSTGPLAYAGAFAKWYKARLTVVHVVPTFDPMQTQPGRLGDPIRIVQPVSREEVLDELRRALDAAGAAALDTTLAAEAGDTVATIVDQAVRIPADLLIMGTHGRSGFDRLLLGSVTEKVLRKAPCPILTVPPHAPATAAVAFKQILCPMDFSPSALQALGFALDLTRQANGAVTVIHVIEWLVEDEPRVHGHFNVAEYRRHLIDDAHERIRGLVAAEARPGSNVQDLVVIGRAYREILQTAATKENDLIVMGAQGRGGVGLTLFGSTTHQVVRAATCPVLTVRG